MNKIITCFLIFTMLISGKAFSQIPTNNDCSGAIDLTFGTQVSGSTEMATVSGVNSSCAFSQHDVWYSFTAPTSGNLYLYLDGGGFLNYTIYDDCVGTNEIDCGNDGENLISALQPGVLYYISITKATLACKGDCDYDFTLLLTQNALSQDSFVLDSFKYYPNPVKEELNISAKHPISTIEIYNALGSKLIIKDVNALNTTLNFSNLESGVYFIKVYYNQNVKTIKVLNL
ncbi:T9SS type A sorting domain-containing protein [Olleya sp. R77988]|uniref:T9SS type A sorting domain-containing protein n=1 Tax=Olleya sp. R77988 TaxID=3093875 RepID=UPI0037CA2236